MRHIRRSECLRCITETPRIIYPPSAAGEEETPADDSSSEVASPKPAEEDTSNANDNTAKSESIDDSSAMPESPPGGPHTLLQLAEYRVPAHASAISDYHEIEKTGILADVRCPSYVQESI